LRLAASAHIIEMTGDKSSLRFYHQLLQEYFAAREMLKRDSADLDKLWKWPWLEKDMPKWVRPERNYDPLPPPPPTNWEETTIMAAGLMPENDDQFLQALLEINPVLAGRCLNEGKVEVQSDTRRRVIERLLETISNPKVALRVRITAGEVLGYLGDPRIGELVTVSAGDFWMGDNEDEDEKPRHKLFLPEYRIAKYPVTNDEFEEFIAGGGYKEKRWWTAAGWRWNKQENWTEPLYWDDTRFKKPNQPIMGVSWYEAVAYCNWSSNETRQPYRLPTEAEWEKAARGTGGRPYPWGKRFDPSRLNLSEGDQTVGSTTPVGIYPAGVSSNQCWDMAGNVWEWTSTQFRNYEYKADDGREDMYAGDNVLRVLRGGSWSLDQFFARCSYRNRNCPDDRSGSLGFRIVVSPIFSSSDL
jgi:formylglycine-generating enzyme required for sulfatase activity